MSEIDLVGPFEAQFCFFQNQNLTYKFHFEQGKRLNFSILSHLGTFSIIWCEWSFSAKLTAIDISVKLNPLDVQKKDFYVVFES